MYWGDMKPLIGNQRVSLTPGNLDFKLRCRTGVSCRNHWCPHSSGKTPNVRVSVEVSLEKASSDLWLLINGLCHCLCSASTDIVSCRGWRTEFWGLDCIFLGENTVSEMTDTDNGCVMMVGNVSRFRIKYDSTVP